MSRAGTAFPRPDAGRVARGTVRRNSDLAIGVALGGIGVVRRISVRRGSDIGHPRTGVSRGA
ncbi:hypothetical protein GCM10009613_61050 [Pseudonocardia kongjuensis]|uniref:Uncharacterized protein n=1 Tax=Pseudonocardia kongjuensis TaxID=102227 RepID=A0ABP4IXT6_9PSEU